MTATGRHRGPFEAALDRAAAGRRLEAPDGVALIEAGAAELAAVVAQAAAMRDAGRGRTVTYSRKVFLPLTNLCRDDCGYCAFKRDPGQPGAHTMSLDEVVRVCRAGARLGCKEALLSLGDKPEARFPEHREWLRRRGFRSTMEYLQAACRTIVTQTPLLPHANPGLMSERDLRVLSETNVSVGLMLETTADRLGGPGGPHQGAPDKLPRLRLRTIEAAGRLGIAFTTGILIGIGETRAERVEALLAIRALHERYGHVQEVIVQNFRAKPGIPMAAHADPELDELRRTVAVARLVLGPAMNVQAPPNLSPGTYPSLIGAGLNDWGGISPLTIDYINPEAPWPHLATLAAATRAAGGDLRERLAIYPEFVRRPGFVRPALSDRVSAYVDEVGLVRGGPDAWLPPGPTDLEREPGSGGGVSENRPGSGRRASADPGGVTGDGLPGHRGQAPAEEHARRQGPATPLVPAGGERG